MNYCNNCERTFGDYNTGEKNPNGDYVWIRSESTSWEWRIRCPHCGNIDLSING